MPIGAVMLTWVRGRKNGFGTASWRRGCKRNGSLGCNSDPARGTYIGTSST